MLSCVGLCLNAFSIYSFISVKGIIMFLYEDCLDLFTYYHITAHLYKTFYIVIIVLVFVLVRVSLTFI